jgi:hypothetical protein
MAKFAIKSTVNGPVISNGELFFVFFHSAAMKLQPIVCNVHLLHLRILFIWQLFLDFHFTKSSKRGLSP